MRIRPETPRDYDTIDAVVEAAFDNTDEVELVRTIRASEHYVPDLTLVAVEGDEVIGHIMLSNVTLVGDEETRVLALAPLAVRPDRQRDGVGIALTEEALRLADERSEPLVIVLGHPDYYPRFGFESARSLGIEPPDPAWGDDAFMVKRLTAYDPALRGRVRYPAAFGLD